VKASVDRKEEKGTITLNDIKTIRISVIGKEKWTKVVKIILLHEPKEAMFRKIPTQEKVPYRTTETIKDKLVLDADGNALGFVDSVILFQDTPGVRVYVSKPSGRVSISLFTRYLEEIGRSDFAALVRKRFMEYPESHRYTATVEELEDFMSQMKLSFKLPENVMTSQDTREFVADIPWSEINKIGDVILLKSTLTDLRSKGHI
jgi:sporulation protein YlmC with PRC-barrel domain